jgi:hypothetical protein
LIGFAPNDQPAPVAPPPTEAIGERRHVTAMFCDLVDSTGIAAKLDAEEWRDLVGAYIDAASAAPHTVSLRHLSMAAVESYGLTMTRLALGGVRQCGFAVGRHLPPQPPNRISGLL